MWLPEGNHRKFTECRLFGASKSHVSTFGSVIDRFGSSVFPEQPSPPGRFRTMFLSMKAALRLNEFRTSFRLFYLHISFSALQYSRNIFTATRKNGRISQSQKHFFIKFLLNIHWMFCRCSESPKFRTRQMSAILCGFICPCPRVWRSYCSGEWSRILLIKYGCRRFIREYRCAACVMLFLLPPAAVLSFPVRNSAKKSIQNHFLSIGCLKKRKMMLS